MDEWTTGSVTLSIGGEPVEMEFTVPAFPIKPGRMLPIFQGMASSFVEIGENAAMARGEVISCAKGCGACCRQPVPISEVEAFQIAELVESLPEPRRTIVKQRFKDACDHFHETEWFERMDSFQALSYDERQRVAMEYFYDQIPCPFLEDESCSIHPYRPLVCREYLVTSPAENCSNPTAQNIAPVKLLFKLGETLRKMRVKDAESAPVFVPLVRSLEWAETHPDNFSEKPGKEWLGEFFKDLAAGES
jgi:Fe-S-cluster containining protein